MPDQRPIWSADCRVSMPEPTGDTEIVPMYGFAMSQYRLVHSISSVEYEELRVPIYSPFDPSLPEDHGDRGT
jgi:hypothetical protein